MGDRLLLLVVDAVRLTGKGDARAEVALAPAGASLWRFSRRPFFAIARLPDDNDVGEAVLMNGFESDSIEGEPPRPCNRALNLRFVAFIVAKEYVEGGRQGRAQAEANTPAS